MTCVDQLNLGKWVYAMSSSKSRPNSNILAPSHFTPQPPTGRKEANASQRPERWCPKAKLNLRLDVDWTSGLRKKWRTAYYSAKAKCFSLKWLKCWQFSSTQAYLVDDVGDRSLSDLHESTPQKCEVFLPHLWHVQVFTTSLYWAFTPNRWHRSR